MRTNRQKKERKKERKKEKKTEQRLTLASSFPLPILCLSTLPHLHLFFSSYIFFFLSFSNKTKNKPERKRIEDGPKRRTERKLEKKVKIHVRNSVWEDERREREGEGGGRKIGEN